MWSKFFLVESWMDLQHWPLSFLIQYNAMTLFLYLHYELKLYATKPSCQPFIINIWDCQKDLPSIHFLQKCYFYNFENNAFEMTIIIAMIALHKGIPIYINLFPSRSLWCTSPSPPFTLVRLCGWQYMLPTSSTYQTERQFPVWILSSRFN